MTTIAAPLSVGDYLNWAESKPNVPNGEMGCIQCGRKIGKSSYWVHASTDGTVLHPDDQGDFGTVSQGFFPVGSECAKMFDKAILVKDVK